MTWSTKRNSGKIFIFFAEKKVFKFSDTKISYALNQLNILTYSEIEFLQNYTAKNH